MGTMPVSSGRGEGAVGGIVRFVESDGAVRRVTTSEEVWENAGKTDRREEESKKIAPQLGGLFEKSVNSFKNGK
jgi:hypothetical protein